QRHQSSMIATRQLVAGQLVLVRAVQRHQPALLTQFDGNENCAITAGGGRAYGRCLHPTSPMVRVRKPKPIGKATLTAPWNLRILRTTSPAPARSGRACR